MAPRYFSAPYFGAYFGRPPSAPAIPGGVPGRYLGAPYFGAYFGRPGPAIHPGPVEALAAWLAADPVIAAAFPGGWSNGDAGPRTDPPYGVFTQVESKSLNLVKAGYSVDRITFHFISVASSAPDAHTAAQAAASGAASAVALGQVLKSRLLPSAGYTPAPLLFRGGIEVSRIAPGGEMTGLDPTRGAHNGDIWQRLVPVVFTFAHGG